MKSDLPERSFKFAVRIVKLCQMLDRQSSVSRTLSRQLLRSGTSIGANLEEAIAGQSKPDFISKQNIALKEARETLYWLRLLVASEVVLESRLTDLIIESNEMISILTASVRTARNNP